MHEERQERFWKKVKRTDGCWLWVGSIKTTGYGEVRISPTKTVTAHRLAWEIYNDRRIPEGLVVRHTCDVRNCVRPTHLVLGTHKENTQDAVERRRTATGENNGQSLLSNEQVKQIARMCMDGWPSKFIAEEFGTTVHTVADIRTGRRWQSVLAEVEGFRRSERAWSLSDIDKQVILEMLKGGMTQQAIADKLGISRSLVSKTKASALEIGVSESRD